MSRFGAGIVAARPGPIRPSRSPSAISPAGVLGRMRPAGAIATRLAAALPASPTCDAPMPRAAAVRPVMAYPVFRDPRSSRCGRWPRTTSSPTSRDLPRDTMTLMEPNGRFIESFLAGLNHELSRELLWREYPTDLRGTYFRVFWDTRDALTPPPARTSPRCTVEGALGGQSGRPAAVLVLVIRGALLQKYPTPSSTAQQARWRAGDTAAARELDPAGEVRHPVFTRGSSPTSRWTASTSARRSPAAAGRRGRARRPPGLVLRPHGAAGRAALRPRRPAGSAGPFETWDDLALGPLAWSPAGAIAHRGQRRASRPRRPRPRTWGPTAADMAAILFQSPVLSPATPRRCSAAPGA